MKRLLRNAVVCALSFVLLASSAAASETTTYSYDALGRLATVRSSGGPADGQAVSTTYDASGNRTTQTVTGVNSGGAQAQLSIGNASATEGGTLNFTVTRSGDASGTASVHYSTANGTAVAPGDFTALSNLVLNFAANQATATISVVTIDDAAAESAENMTVTLSNASGATIATATGTGTINATIRSARRSPLRTRARPRAIT